MLLKSIKKKRTRSEQDDVVIRTSNVICDLHINALSILLLQLQIIDLSLFLVLPAVNLLDSRSVLVTWGGSPTRRMGEFHTSSCPQHFELRAGLGEHLKVSDSLDGRKDRFKVKNNRTWRAQHRERGTTRGQRQTEKKGKPFFVLKEAQRHTKPAVLISL